MVPVPIAYRNSHSSRLLHILFTVGTQYVSYFIRSIFFNNSGGLSDHPSFLVRRHEPTDPKSTKFIVFAVLIPLLVLLSGLFAGLTLGYMSLDETQLNVLSISGTPYVNAFYHWSICYNSYLVSRESMPHRLCPCARMAICFSSHYFWQT